MNRKRFNYIAQQREACAWTQDSIARGDECWRDERTGAVFVDRAAAEAAGCA